MKNSFSDYLFSPLVWIQIIILFLLLTLLALVITPLGPLLGAWAGNSLVKGLTIEGVSGSLLTSLKVERVEWVDGDTTTFSGVELEPGRPDFSRNLAIIDNLTIDSLSIALEENTASRKRGEKVVIGDFGTEPVNLLIKAGSLNSFLVTEGAETVFQLNALNLAGTQTQDNQLILKDMQTTMVIPDQPPVELAIAGMTMDMLEPHEISLNSDLRWLSPDVGAVNINVKGSGLLQQYVLSASGDIVHPDFGKQVMTLQGKGDFDFIDIERLKLKGDDGAMSASGELAWVPHVSADLNIDSNGLKTAQFTPEWPAEITGNFKLKGQFEQEQLRGELDISTLKGRLRGYPISGSGKVSMLNQELIFDKLALRSADNSIKVDGRGSEPFDLTWDVEGKDISTLASGLTGRVTANGSLNGTIAEPVLNGLVKADRLSFQGNKVESANLDVKTRGGQFQLSGKGRGVLLNGEQFRDISLRGNGDLKKHSIALSADHPEAKLAAAVVGEWDAGTWRSRINELSVDNAALGRWRLAKPANVSISTSGVEAEELCLVSTNGSACTQIDYSEQTGFATAGELKNTPLELLNPFLPPEMALKGRAAGRYKVSLNPDLKGNADLKFTTGEFSMTQDGKIKRFAYQRGSVVAEIDGDNIKSDINFDLSPQGSIAATADIKLSPSDGQHIVVSKGQFQEVPLGLVQPFLPEGMNLTGQASGLFDVQQTEDERFGKVSLISNDVRFMHTDSVAGRQQFNFDNLKVDATLTGDNLVADAALSIRGGGSFSTRATADLGQPDLVKSIEAEGQLSDMPLALTKSYLPKGIAVDGLLSGQY